MGQSLFWKDLEGLLLRCVDEDEAHMIMTNLHSGVCYGQHHWKYTTLNILRDGYYFLHFFMCLQVSELVWNAIGLLENKNCCHCH